MQKVGNLRHLVSVGLIFPRKHFCDLVFVPSNGICKCGLRPIPCDNFAAQSAKVQQNHLRSPFGEFKIPQQHEEVNTKR